MTELFKTVIVTILTIKDAPDTTEAMETDVKPTSEQSEVKQV